MDEPRTPEGRQTISELVAAITEITAPLTGGDYFRTLVSRLAAHLAVGPAIATECLDYPQYHVRTLAYWEGEKFGENFSFDVRGTPCEDVVEGGEFCFYPDRVTECFPDYAEKARGLRGYIGIPVLAPSDGRVLGHIAVFSTSPLAPDAVTESMFRIIAARAGAEIERLQAERALRDSEARARQHLAELAHVSRLGSMGELASALAHEVNQPLTAVITYTQTLLKMLEQGRLGEAELRQGLDRTLASAQHAREVVSKLRAFIKRGEMKRRPVPAARMIRDCRVLLEAEANHHHVTLNMTVPEDLPTVRADVVLIQQVIFNLMRNGIEAINDSDNPRREMHLDARHDGERIVVCVTDSGKGVPEALRDSLFNPFVSTRKQGLGIGLSLCRSVVDRHGGRIWCEETRQPGATFCFSLPVHRPD